MSYDGPHGWQWIPLIGTYIIGTIIHFLDGKKTYIGVVLFVCLAVFQFYTGHPDQAWQSLIAAWTAMGLRSAIAKVPAAEIKAAQSVGISR